MILDFITRMNNMNYNVKLGKLFGVYSAVFISLLLDQHYCYPEEEFVKLSRQAIYDLTGLEEERQIDVEQNLISYNLLQLSKVKNSNSKNYYKLNLDMLNKILYSKIEEVESELQKTAQVFKQVTKPPSNVSKRASIILALKKNIKTDDTEAKEALQNWIDNVYQKTGYLSKDAVIFMENTLNEKANNSIVLFRELCRTAARLVYKEPKWVIKNYEDNNLGSNNNLRLNNLEQEEVDSNIEQLKNYNGETF